MHDISNFWGCNSVILRIAKKKKLCYLIDTRKKQTSSTKKREAKAMVDPNISES